MDPEGSNPAQLTHDLAAKDQLPEWSPDGKRIAHQTTATGNGDIYVMDRDGGTQTRLTRTPDVEFGPAWSPDGRRIAYVRHTGTRQSGRGVHVMKADGTRQHYLARGGRVPAWQPRGHCR